MHFLSASPQFKYCLSFFILCLCIYQSGIAQLPTVTTASVTSITSKDASSGGSVASQGLTAVTARGVCWSSTNKLPTTSDKVMVSGSGVGIFKSAITGLTMNTTYFVRAFATNGSGTAYGNMVTFKTADLARVTTSSITDITVADARAYGNVLSDGGSLISSRGVCWSTSLNPTVDLTTRTNDGNTQGVFSSKITGLLPNTTYFVRAYVTTSAGTQYGAQISFRTEPTITIGTQVWTQKNLNVTRFRNGDIITWGLDSALWTKTNQTVMPARCWYKDDSVTNAATYGRLYNWYAVNDPRGLCPTGWHVPTKWEWISLINFVKDNIDVVGSNTGGKMKSTGNQYWWNPNTGATNSSGFSGLPGGMRYQNANFYRIQDEGFWWSSTEEFANTAFNSRLYHSSSDALVRSEDKRSGLSVRCVKD